MNGIELIEDYPASIATRLLKDEIDIGLIPVAVIPELKESHIITDYCIGSEGDVASVALFSEVPLTEVRKVLLDYQSRTSVQLVRILLKEYWQLEVEFEQASLDYIHQIKGSTAGVIIGDRALQQRHISPYTYDLATAWKDHTGLPFVFAAWVANKPIDAEFIDAFNQANKYGIMHLDKVLATAYFEYYDLKTYYTQNIQYQLTDDMRAGLALFLEKINQSNPL